MKDANEYLKTIDNVISRGPFQDTWDSLTEYKLAPWYRNAKFGIFIHWGLYSVPAFENEWYSRNMYIKDSSAYKHHLEVYGPHKKFGYKDFIPMFTADKFNAEEWAELFEAAGARYVCPVAEHHDGFQMYASDISHFNAAEMGPKQDILGSLYKAFEKHNIISAASSHRFEHWFFMGHGREFDSDIKPPLRKGDFYWPAMPEPDHHDLFSKPAPDRDFMEDWLLRTCEIVDKYRPKLIYFDWWIQHSAAKPYLKKFAAYYYNRAAEWGTPVVITYKHDAFMFGTAVIDIERGQLAQAKPYYWQTDTSVARNSWCYTPGNDYRSACGIIQDLSDIVSKNGCLMLNIGPKADGTIPDEDRRILLEIGKWLRINEEAIYGSRLYRVSGEGPTKIQEGQFADGVEKNYTSRDIRFTMKGTSLFAIVLKYPEDGIVKITSLGEKDASRLPLFHGIIKFVEVLGFDEVPEITRTADALVLKTNTVSSGYPVIFKITLD